MLLLDEITVDLDVLGRADLLAFLRDECEQRGATIIYVRRSQLPGISICLNVPACKLLNNPGPVCTKHGGLWGTMNPAALHLDLLAVQCAPTSLQ